jgi:hypothetical protein
MDAETLMLLGGAVCSAQKLEFGLYGIAAHCSHLPEARKDKRFANLNAKDFLSNEPEKRALRKATLGQIAKLFANAFMLPLTELEELVERRNLIFHEFWREVTNKRGTSNIADPKKFLVQFISDCEEWIAAIEGLISFLKEAAATKEGRLDEIQITEIEQIKRDKFLDMAKKWQDGQTSETS